MCNIKSQVKPFSFRVKNRVYRVDFVYKVLGITGESGSGKTLFMQDISTQRDLPIISTDGIAKYSVVTFSGITQSDEIYSYILKTKQNSLSNKIIIIDDIQYLDFDLILQGIKRTKGTNTQWVLLGQGDFPGIVAVDAIRSIEHSKNKKTGGIEFWFEF